MNSRQILRQNLIFYLSRSDLTQKDIAQKLGVSKGSVSGWFAGTNYPRADKLDQLAALLGVSSSDLTSDRSTRTSVPVLGRVHAGDPTLAVQETLDYIDIPDSMASQGDYFALYVQGDSMAPDFQEGDTVIVRRQPTLETGDIGVFSIGGDGGEDATIKEYKCGERNIFLIPHNEAYPILMYSFKEVDLLPVLTLGKVVELRRSF